MTMEVDLCFEGELARIRFEGKNGVQVFSADARVRLANVLAELEQAADCRVVVFEAEGRTFIAGADIKELQQLDYESGLAIARAGQRLMQRIANLNAVTVAAVNAACAGGGCELALACDLRLAAESAVIGLPEVKLGLIPGWGGTARAVRLFGSAVAKRMILSGELLSAADAARLGIVDAVIADAEFRDAVDHRVEQLLVGGPHALAAAKRLIAEFEGGDIESQLEAEAEAFARCCDNEESTEGATAFLEKRPPQWS
jgi:enoyl-CoA hydratase/carnithine racemase